MTYTNTASAAGHTALANSLRGELRQPVGRDGKGRITHEYGEIIADVSRPPRPSLWTRFTLALAGQA